MIYSSRRFNVAHIEKAAKLLYSRENIPDEMPRLKGGYRLIAILEGTNWQYGQLIHNSGFYKGLRMEAPGCHFTITELYSIHPIALETIPDAPPQKL